MRVTVRNSRMKIEIINGINGFRENKTTERF